MIFPCPHCGSASSKTVDARSTKSGIRRRRECRCGHRYTTREIPDEQLDRYLMLEKLLSALNTLGPMVEDLGRQIQTAQLKSFQRLAQHSARNAQPSRCGSPSLSGKL